MIAKGFVVEFDKSKSVQSEKLGRGRVFNTQEVQNLRKKNVLVIKKESINRQNSFSRSPRNAQTQDNQNVNLPSPPFLSPKSQNEDLTKDN